MRRHFRPCAFLERFARRLHCLIDVAFVAFGDQRQNFLVCRIDRLDVLPDLDATHLPPISNLVRYRRKKSSAAEDSAFCAACSIDGIAVAMVCPPRLRGSFRLLAHL